MINLNNLKAEDIVVFRNGEEAEVASVGEHNGLIIVEYEHRKGRYFMYYREGKFNPYKTVNLDIVKVKPSEIAETELISIEISLVKANIPKYMRTLTDCFGIKRNEIPRPSRENAYHEQMILVCRPDQFAKFIILRNERNITNLIKELNPQYVQKFQRNLLVAYVAEN